MKTISGSFKFFFYALLLFFAFAGKAHGQCSISSNTNASALVCGISPLYGCNGILYIGDGLTPMTLNMDAELNLTCLGAIRLIVRNGAIIDFTSGNYRLYLGEGSSINFEGNGTLLTSESSCNASERIYIGTNLLASCNGNAGADYSFADLLKFGGTGNATSNSPVCVGNSINLSATPPPNGGAYTYSWSGPGLSATTYNSNPDLTVSASISGVYQVKMKSSLSGNPIMIAEITVVVNALPAQPTLSAETAICYGFTANWSASTGATSYAIDVSTDSGFTSFVNGYNNLITGNVNTYTINGLTPSATYYYRVRAKNNCGISSNSSTGTYSPAGASGTTVWNGSWSNGTPNANMNIVFAGAYTSPNNLTGCSCQVNTGVNVIITSPGTLTITNEVAVLGSGTLVFKSDLSFPTSSSASLVQLNNVATNANSGNITYERITNTTVRYSDYTFWSSPVYPQILNDLSPKTSNGMFGSYEVTASSEYWMDESSGTIMEMGKGYIVRAPDFVTVPPPPTQYISTFKGVPNNGKLSISGIYADKSYLIGNPYPSAINADLFLAENAGVLNGTLYFWTHNTQIGIGVANPGSGLYAYSSDDYATYNITGGVGIDPFTSTSAAGSTGGNTSVPSGKIAAGQGFFASSKITISGTNEIVFNNDIRISGASGNNSQFFKTASDKAVVVTAIEKHRIWLNLTNTQGAFKQTLVGYITDASNAYDDRFDGVPFKGNPYVDFYSVLQDKELTIQGRALPFDENDVVALGFRSSIDGSFSISIDQTDGLLTNQPVFIEDKLTNTVFDLKTGAYTFTTVAGTFNDRFVLRYTNKTLGTDNFDAPAHTVLVSMTGKQIRINSATETIDKVLVYDLSGKQVYRKTNVNSNELLIPNLVASHQVLVVKTVLQNGQAVNKKIVY